MNASLPSNTPLTIPPCYKGLQSACLKVLNYSSAYFGPNSSSVLQSYLAQKLQVTLKSRNEDYVPVEFVNNWFLNLQPILNSANPYVRVCWLRTVCGGWTTSVRMHQETPFEKCFLGCRECEDTLSHYLACPVLWSLSREISGISELSPSVHTRLSLVNPHIDQLKLLAFCHALYHYAINDEECKLLFFNHSQPMLQRKLISIGRQLKHQIT